MRTAGIKHIMLERIENKIMGVTTYFFVLIFLPIVLIGWRMLLNINCHDSIVAVFFLIFVSLWFIGSYDYRFVPIMLAIVAINYYAVRFMKSMLNTYLKRAVEIILVGGNLSILLILKYANWVGEILGQLDQPRNLILPLGISFYTLEQIMYIVDNYKDDKYDYSFINYLAYSIFFL